MLDFIVTAANLLKAGFLLVEGTFRIVFGIPFVGGWLQTIVTLVVLWYIWKWMPLFLKSRLRPAVAAFFGWILARLGGVISEQRAPEDSPAKEREPPTKLSLKRGAFLRLRWILVGVLLLLGYQNPAVVSDWFAAMVRLWH